MCWGCHGTVHLDWRHCGNCGLRLATDHEPEREHVVTVVVSDLQGSTALAENLDPESLRLVLDRYFDELGAVLQSHGGRIEKRIGDAMVTVFGLPAPRPDDAVRALRAASESQQTLAKLNVHLEAGWGVRLTNRTGVSSGRVVYATAGRGHRVLAGQALDVAVGLEPLAPPLEVLVSATTAEAAADHSTFAPVQTLSLKDGAVVSAQRLLSVDAGDAEPPPTTDAQACSICGAAAPTPLQWCVSCGSPLARGARRHESRRTLTIVFADLAVEHARQSVGESSERAAMLAAFEIARRALDMHGGTVENFIGDAVMAVFGLARRNEDDALRAVRAALDVQAQLVASSADLSVRYGVRVVARIGVNTGPVIAGDPRAGERLVTGDAVNVAARLEQTARAGDVVIGDLTRRLAGARVTWESLPPLTLKGKAEPVPAYRVLDVQNASTLVRRFELPFLGRNRELETLRSVWQQTADARSWRRVRIRGDAGIGKSRLVHQLLDDLGPTTRVLRGGCLPYGEGITFWPVAEMVRAAVDISTGTDADSARTAIEAASPDAEVAVRIQALLGLDARNVPVPELFWAIGRLLDHIATEHPLVVVIDGLQWAEPTLIDLLTDLVQRGSTVPALLLTMERRSDDEPEDRAEAQAEDVDVTELDLAPLDETTCDDLITEALGSAALPVRVRDQIVRSSAGVALFIEQLLTMLIDDGRLVEEGTGWRLTGTVDSLHVPPTIEAVLAARIDALPDDEVAVIEPASVIGREFPLAAVAELRSAEVSPPVLAALVRRQLVAPSSSADALTDHRFRNLLIRDVVYDGLLKRSRASLHARFANWLVNGQGAGRALEIGEIVGYHFEQAYILGAEVSAIDEAATAIGCFASQYLGDAGERAFARGDMPAAANLLERAARTVPAEARAAALLVQAGDAKVETGQFAEAIERYNEAEQLAVRVDDAVTAASAALARTSLRYLTGDGVDDAAARDTIAALLRVFETNGDHAGIARCWRLQTSIEMFHCQWGAAQAAAMETIQHAQQAGDTVLEHRILPVLAGFALYGPTPVDQALRLCDEVLVDAGSDVRGRSLIQQYKSHLLALSGDFEEARQLCTLARAGLLEFGWKFDAALVSIHRGPVELMAGDAEAAERHLRVDYDTLTAMGERNYLSTTAYLLGEAVRRQGRQDEALELAAQAAEMAAADDVFTHIGWRMVRLRVLAERGELEAAARLARETLELVMTTDGPYAQAEAFVDLAAILTRTGDREGARAAAQEAAQRFATKQTPHAEQRARALQL